VSHYWLEYALVNWLVSALALYLMAQLMPGIEIRGFGTAMIATVVFGFSRHMPLSLFCLALLGAADMFSVYVRQSLIQLYTPDEMRGRVGAVSSLFISASNELGEFESGVTAALFGVVPAVVVGGIGTCAVVALWAWLFPDLRRVDSLEKGVT